eukprot:275013_1
MKVIWFILLLSISLQKSVERDLLSSTYDFNDWSTEGPPYLPRADWLMAIASDSNNTIYILGGGDKHNRYQLTSYNITDGNFTDHGLNVLSRPTWGYGQYHTQINNMLYLIDSGGGFLDVFNSQTQQFKMYNGPNIPINVGYWGCLASYDQFLFVIGGYHYNNSIDSLVFLNDIQILNLSSNAWISSTPKLNVARYAATCLVNSNSLYVMGGVSHSGYLNTIEKLSLQSNLINLTYSTFTFIDNLLHQTAYFRAINHHHQIITIGGYPWLSEINVINTITDTVQLGGFMNTGLRGAAVIVINTNLYVFGGYNGNDPLNTWQSIDLYPSPSPTTSPTSLPTKTPTLPTVSPTFFPTFSPTLSPTFSPTISPTFTPSISPTDSPSFSPTSNPTNLPTTSDAYDSKIDIVYIIGNLSNQHKEIDKIIDDPITVIHDVAQFIQIGYAQQYDIEYQYFTIQINQLNGYNIEDIKTDLYLALTLELNSEIKCKINWCEYIIDHQRQRVDLFKNNVEIQIRDYFVNSELTFGIKTDIDDLEVVPLHIDDLAMDVVPLTPVVIGTLCFMGIMFMISICALLHNKNKLYFLKIPGSNIVDDAQWVTVGLYAIQCWDLLSDINLSIEIMEHPLFTLNKLDLVTLCGFASVFFTVFPYISNLYLASKVKRLIKDNDRAKSWFEQYLTMYVVLVCLSGGAYTALTVVSSNIFGLNMFSTGMTKYKIRSLSSLKLKYNVIFENLPQLLIQILYCFAIHDISNNTILAFTASLISVISEVLHYVIHKRGDDDDDVVAVQYYLFTEFDNDRASLTTTEKCNFINNRGRTNALSTEIAEVFGIHSNSIEIGYSILSKYGIITYVVHFVYHTQLQQSMSITTPQYFVRQLYLSHANAINTVFRHHFGINDDFQTIYSPNPLSTNITTPSLSVSSQKHHDLQLVDMNNKYKLMIDESY